MPKQVLDNKVVYRKLIGYIGEHTAENYLQKQGFDAHVLGNSGIGTRIGDIFIRRKWFHNNGRCEGHWETFPVEVKSTALNEFRLELTQRQKARHDRNTMPILSIKISGIHPNTIDYEVLEIPSNWTQSPKLASWKGEPKYYDQHAPSPCHKVRNPLTTNIEDERRWKDRRYLKSIKRIRTELEEIGYSIIKKSEL